MRNLAATASTSTAYAIDFIGHGYSTKPEHPLEIRHYLDQLLQFWTRSAQTGHRFSGESLGGWVTARFAQLHPDRVNRIVLNTMGGTMANPKVMERL